VSDTKGKGSLSFAEFRRAVRRANIKATAISDEDLVSIVKMVDTDGSGFIELDEFLAFLRPEHVPDIECRASNWVSPWSLAADTSECACVRASVSSCICVFKYVFVVISGCASTGASVCVPCIVREYLGVCLRAPWYTGRSVVPENPSSRG
jgi:hypothetical protein